MFPGRLLYLIPVMIIVRIKMYAELFYALEFLVPFEAGLYVKELWKIARKI